MDAEPEIRNGKKLGCRKNDTNWNLPNWRKTMFWHGGKRRSRISECGVGVRSQKLVSKNDIITRLRLFHIDGFDYKQFALDCY